MHGPPSPPNTLGSAVVVMVTTRGSSWAGSGLHCCGRGVCSDLGWTHSSKMAHSPAAHAPTTKQSAPLPCSLEKRMQAAIRSLVGSPEGSVVEPALKLWYSTKAFR